MECQKDGTRPFDPWFNLTLNRAYANIQPTWGPSFYAQNNHPVSPGKIALGPVLEGCFSTGQFLVRDHKTMKNGATGTNQE